MKTILTLDKLVEFCQTQKIKSFSAKESGYRLAVQIPAQFEVEESEDDLHRGMLKLKLKAFHTGRNRNGSFVSEESADKAMLTMANRPILASIHQLDNGEWDFHSHDMEFVEGENGEEEVIYIEQQVGSFSSEPAFKEYDEERDVNFICAYAYIPREYTKAAEIIERKNGTKNSVELSIEKMTYDTKEKCLSLDEFYVAGSTLLGCEKDGTEIEEGMLGSRADIADFKEEPVKFEQNSELIKALENLNETLSRFNINDTLGKEEQEVKDIEEKELTIFDLNDPEPEPEETEETTEETTVTEGSDEGDDDSSTDGDDEPTFNPAINDDDPDILNKIKFEVETTDGTKREFSLTIAEKLNAAYNLVNATYGMEDNDFYDVDMNEEFGCIEMYGWFTGKNYRQSYEFAEDSLVLTGERTEIFKTYLTAEEKASIEQMRTEYSSMQKELQNYREEPQKMEILNLECYEKISSVAEFENLKLQENHFNMSIEEVNQKADAILLDYAKHNNFSLLSESEGKAQIKSVTIPTVQKKENRYGTLFSKKG